MAQIASLMTIRQHVVLKIVHFAGAIKPWQNASCDMASYFWKYVTLRILQVIIQDMVPE